MDSILIEPNFNKTTVQRILYSNNIDKNAPTVIVFAGIHGNEPAGVLGLQKVIHKIENEQIKFKGNFVAIAGNLNALSKNIRFEKEDLNRIWTHDHISKIKKGSENLSAEEKELFEIYFIIKEILSEHKGPFYFIDLHTTSANTIPFITISDSLNNRKFANNFPLPIVLGIEEYLDGPLLTFINEFGHISLGFEAGQHEDVKSIEICEAFIWQVLDYCNCILKKDVLNYQYFKQLLNQYELKKVFFEIDYRYNLSTNNDFMMLGGFKNFDAITKHQTLALNHQQAIKAPLKGYIFMPLYQNKGDDGFFIIRKISNFWLQVSITGRKLKLHHFLKMLPGIKQDTSNKYTLIVNPKTAQFLTNEIFHLFGYRKKVKKGKKLYFIKRDRDIKIFEV